MNFDSLNDVENIEITDNESTHIEIKLLTPNPFQPRLKDTDVDTLNPNAVDFLYILLDFKPCSIIVVFG